MFYTAAQSLVMRRVLVGELHQCRKRDVIHDDGKGSMTQWVNKKANSKLSSQPKFRQYLQSDRFLLIASALSVINFPSSLAAPDRGRHIRFPISVLFYHVHPPPSLHYKVISHIIHKPNFRTSPFLLSWL